MHNDVVAKTKNLESDAIIRDRPFDIQGGTRIFPCDKLFFSLFLHNKFLFSSKLQQFFLRKSHIKIKKGNKAKH